MPSGRTLQWRERYSRRLEAGRQVAPQLSQGRRDPVPALCTPDEAYVYRERLAILCGPDREPTQAELDMANGDILRLRKENEGENEGAGPCRGEGQMGEGARSAP